MHKEQENHGRLRHQEDLQFHLCAGLLPVKDFVLGLTNHLFVLLSRALVTRVLGKCWHVMGLHDLYCCFYTYMFPFVLES